MEENTHLVLIRPRLDSLKKVYPKWTPQWLAKLFEILVISDAVSFRFRWVYGYVCDANQSMLCYTFMEMTNVVIFLEKTTTTTE
jgi:hypothetical protein